MYIVVATPHTQAIASFHCPKEKVARVPVQPSIAALSAIILISKKICVRLSLFFVRASARARN